MQSARIIAVATTLGLSAAGQAHALTITPTTNGSALLTALLPSSTGFGSATATYDFGNSAQVGTFTGFTSGSVTLPSGGVVLSTGKAADTTAASHTTGTMDVDGAGPSTNLSGGSTPEITAYAPGKVANFIAAYDAARLTVTFTLSAANAIAFDFVFGSSEYPGYTSKYTDAAYVFLDGTQISFDANGTPVQVGTSFGKSLTTADTNTAFYGPHGLIGPLTTTSSTLTAGTHILSFEVADTNDRILDSALFVSNLRLSNNAGGPVTGDPTSVPEPASMAMLGAGLIGLLTARRRGAR